MHNYYVDVALCGGGYPTCVRAQKWCSRADSCMVWASRADKPGTQTWTVFSNGMIDGYYRYDRKVSGRF